MIAPVTGGGASGRAVPARACELAARLSALFHRDSLIAGRLNDAQRRVREANERLWSGLAPDAFGLRCDGVAAAGQSQIAGLIRDAVGGGREPQAVVLGALQDVHWTIHRASCEFQSASEERRRLAVEVGELSWQLTEALMSAGWSADDAQDANVHEISGAGIR
jgi:hypothetical protein